MPAKPAASGFTLLEVVVALAIAALALVVLFRAGGEGLLAVDAGSRAEEAIERAQSHLAAIGGDIASLPRDAEGVDGGGYRWRLRIEPLAQLRQPPAPATGAPAMTTTLFDVQVTISWPGHDHERAVVLRTERLGEAGEKP